jgi:hypothetical protein
MTLDYIVDYAADHWNAKAEEIGSISLAPFILLGDENGLGPSDAPKAILNAKSRAGDGHG